MTKILLDTSIIIDYLRVKNKSQTVLYRLTQNKHELYVSIITHTEAYSGKSVWEQKEARNILKNTFEGIKILPLEENISENAGEIKAKYGLEIADAIIAATALKHKLELATLNIKDFEKNVGLKLKKI